MTELRRKVEDILRECVSNIKKCEEASDYAKTYREGTDSIILAFEDSIPEEESTKCALHDSGGVACDHKIIIQRHGWNACLKEIKSKLRGLK